MNDSSAHQSVMWVNPAVGGALGRTVGWVPTPQHATMVTLLAHTAATAAPGITTVMTIWWTHVKKGRGGYAPWCCWSVWRVRGKTYWAYSELRHFLSNLTVAQCVYLHFSILSDPLCAVAWFKKEKHLLSFFGFRNNPVNKDLLISW